MKKLYNVFVYGTLRPNRGEEFTVAGSLHDLGWYPGIRLGGEGKVVVEKLEVDGERLAQLDHYEGYDPDDEANSLYLRQSITVDGIDGFIYVYNNDMSDRPLIVDGDWTKYLIGKEEYA